MPTEAATLTPNMTHEERARLLAVLHDRRSKYLVEKERIEKLSLEPDAHAAAMTKAMYDAFGVDLEGSMDGEKEVDATVRRFLAAIRHGPLLAPPGGNAPHVSHSHIFHTVHAQAHGHPAPHNYGHARSLSPNMPARFEGQPPAHTCVLM